MLVWVASLCVTRSLWTNWPVYISMPVCPQAPVAPGDCVSTCDIACVTTSDAESIQPHALHASIPFRCGVFLKHGKPWAL